MIVAWHFSAGKMDRRQARVPEGVWVAGSCSLVSNEAVRWRTNLILPVRVRSRTEVVARTRLGVRSQSGPAMGRDEGARQRYSGGCRDSAGGRRQGPPFHEALGEDLRRSSSSAANERLSQSGPTGGWRHHLEKTAARADRRGSHAVPLETDRRRYKACPKGVRRRGGEHEAHASAFAP